jgi:cell division septation protein DedD
VAIAAAIAAFFMMSTPVVNSDLGSNAMSQLQNNILYKLMPKDTNTIPAEPVVEPVANKAQASADSVETVAPASPTITYYIVVASQVKRSNAENYVEKLHRQGYEDARVFIHKNVVRVTCGEYDSESEAYRHLRKLNNKEEFADAWIYKTAEV